MPPRQHTEPEPTSTIKPFRRPSPEWATKTLVVAAKNVEPGDALTADHLTLQKWPEESVPKGVFFKNKGLIGRVVPNGLVKGEPVMLSKLAPEGAAGGMSAVVAEGMRAVTVQVDEVIGVAGYVKKGDRGGCAGHRQHRSL